MRSRRLPLGSPSRKERPGKDDGASATFVPNSSTNKNSKNNEESRVRTRQAPSAARKESSTGNPSNKRVRRTNRGLPLSSATSQSVNNAKTPLEAQSTRLSKKKHDEEVVVAEVVVEDNEESSVGSKSRHSNDLKEKDKLVKKHEVAAHTVGTISKKRTRSHSTSTLHATRPDGSDVRIKVFVHKKAFSYAEKSPKTMPKKQSLGIDGNQFNCAHCGEFGDVVCCDGCPKVYHPECLSDSLSNDDEPWFCPSCVEGKKSKITSKKSRPPGTGAHHDISNEVKTSVQDDDVYHQCDACGADTESPFNNEKGDTLCSECFASEADIEVPHDDEESVDVASSAGQEHQATNTMKKSERKRKAEIPMKRKKKKKKAHKDFPDTADVEPEPTSLPLPAGHVQGKPGIAQATPAFYFYLVENKGKIERELARRNRHFSRLNKAGEKNALIAKEAAIWWSKLLPADQKQYIDMSMRDFEGRIIEWKEDKSIREMSSNEGTTSDPIPRPESNLLEEDEKLTWKRHQRLYLSTSVGSKPFKPEPDQAYNRVLQDLLHDTRFHPLPMLSTSRPEQEEEKDDIESRVLIPYFDVHGPVSTSVGDSCLGCMRSWNHYCPVLQRRVPAVEHRARLQPPVSSLLATRVGLGLRPHLTRPVVETALSDEEHELFTWKKSKRREDMMNLPIVPSSTLSAPDDRMDDIVMFVEETTAMKVPEPARPEINAKSQLRSLPLQASKSEESHFKKCGRCRAIIQGDTGCVQCRRAQLVINMAKRQKQDGKLLKVHTSMLGRYNTKETTEPQSEADEAVASAMLKERWTPSAVLPAERMYAPNHIKLHHSRRNTRGDEAYQREWSSPGNSEYHMKDRESRARSTRVPAVSNEIYEPHERQEIMEKNRRAVNAFHKIIVPVACAGMLQALVRRDPLKLFDQPVTDETYYTVIKCPMFFCNIRDKLSNNQYTSLGAMANDVKQLIDNTLSYNPPNSIYAKTAAEIHEQFGIMHKRASNWVSALKDAYATYLNNGQCLQTSDDDIDDAFAELRENWPEAYDLYRSGEWLKNHAFADFVRTEENEVAFFGSLAVSRVAVAAETSLAPYTDIGGCFGVVSQRKNDEDKELRDRVDSSAAVVVGPLNMSTPSTWREESVHRLLRKVQSRRLDRLTASEQGCARCDGLVVDHDVVLNMKAEAVVGKVRKHEDSDLPRVDGSRIDLTTGRASAKLRSLICERRQEKTEEQYDSAVKSCVSVRGSRIHGLGLFADQEFRKGDVVAEYVGEYISNEEFETREVIYRENRTQDYSFRISADYVIDATRQGGPGRYANHDCNPNCASKIVSGKEVNIALKRVMIVALRSIKINEEITYDYQFPLEQDLTARIPCNCRSDDCRGFMNWDLPEKGSNNRAVLVQKRGANMRDRIRRLNRPLKRDEL